MYGFKRYFSSFVVISAIHFSTDTVVESTNKVLGQGAYGKVVEVKHQGKRYAAKIYHYGCHKSLKSFQKEVEILTKVRHQNIVSYFGVCKLSTQGAHDQKVEVLIMERMEKDLKTHLESTLSLQKKFGLLQNIACGLDYLHRQKPPIVHRDLTVSNVLLDSHDLAKIADFGNSCIVDKVTMSTANPGTQDYMPPEASEGGYDFTIDIFSYGHLALYTMLQKHPYPLLEVANYESSGETLARSEVQRREEFINKLKIMVGEGHTVLKTILRCLDDDPEKRPHSSELIQGIDQKECY